MASSDADREDGFNDDPDISDATFVLNSTYIAFREHGRLAFQRFGDEDAPAKFIDDIDTVSDPRPRPVLALSSLKPRYLAVARGSQVIVYDLEDVTIRINISGVGRSVTSIAWTAREPLMLATGLIDGSICTWSLDQTTRPLQRFVSAFGPCRCIDFSPLHDGILASSHGSLICLWSMRNRIGPLETLLSVTHTEKLMWSLSTPGLLISLGPIYGVCIWDVLDTIDDIREGGFSEPERQSNDFDVGRNHGHKIPRQSIACRPRNICWLDDEGILAVLVADGRAISLFERGEDRVTLHEVCTSELPHTGCALRLKQEEYRLVIVVESPLLSQSAAFSDLQINADKASNTLQTIDVSWKAERRSLVRKGSTGRPEGALCGPNAHMLPVLLEVNSERVVRDWSQLRSSSEDPQHFFRFQTRGLTRLSARNRDHADLRGLDSRPNSRHSCTTSQPRTTIGRAVKTSSVTDVGLTNLINTQRHNRQRSRLAATPSTTHESDSDDDAFQHISSGDAAIVPKAVNVPLPKRCSAIFTPQGQLLTFLPVQTQSAFIRQSDVNPPSSIPPEVNIRISRIFPDFGRLLPSSPLEVDSSASDSSSDHTRRRRPPTTFWSNIASPTHDTWPSGRPAISGDIHGSSLQKKVIMHIRSIESLVTELTSSNLAYRVFPSSQESSADMAKANAESAQNGGHAHAAFAWSLLSRILAKEPLEQAGEISDLPIDDRLERDGDTRESKLSLHYDPLRSPLRMAKNSSTGGEWLVLRLFAWLNELADIQSLSYLSAALLAARKFDVEDYVSSQATAEGSANISSARLHSKGSRIRAQGNAAVSPSSEHSPTKYQRGSRVSSRNTSQPATPYYESTVYTPPLILPSFSRQGSKLQAPGSASPEHSRGTFSAAARYYAQSITDKFNMYGSSPPFKKQDRSPSSGDLSSSLPIGPASWSKSVSFASTVGKSRESQLSSSFTVSQDGYDSDKTIEDGSVPQTPKSGYGDVLVEVKNEEAFALDPGNGLLSNDLVQLSAMWRRYHAAQLRSHGELMKAAELEGLLEIHPPTGTAPVTPDGIVVTTTSTQRKARCEVCLTATNGVKQICPSCFHVSHLACLTSLLDVSTGDGFTCPSGCGCACMDLPFEAPVDLQQETADGPVVTTSIVKKKTSFTDPALWRARIENDSW